MQRRNRDWTLMDGLTVGLGGPKSAAFFERCNQLIPWSKLAAAISDVYDDQPGKGGWPLEMMIRCLMLQKWFHLSDPQLEEMLQDRLSFRRLVGLADSTEPRTSVSGPLGLAISANIHRARLPIGGTFLPVPIDGKRLISAPGTSC